MSQVRAGARSAPEGYRMFFLSTIAVAPNKFRPMSKMGELRCHPARSFQAKFLQSFTALSPDNGTCDVMGP